MELKCVCFHYESSGQVVLDDADVAIGAGEFVAVTGPSGCGKSTFVKLAIGLLQPTSGEILFDGRAPGSIGLAAFRKQLGVVLQDDVIFCGTFAENISLFDEAADHDWMRECAAIAGLDEEIMARRLGYHSDVLDHTSGLSGGQRQRLFLARALYRNPRILILDECTSHLDVAKESEVCASISRLPMTRIMITHRPETIAAADRVYTLKDHKLVEITRVQADAPTVTPGVSRRLEPRLAN